MRRSKRRRAGGPGSGVLIAIALIGVASGSAEAQWYPGGFWGGLYPIPYTPPSVEFLNRQALDVAAHASPGPISGGAAEHSPNAYYNHVRDPDFFQRYDIETRRAMEDRVARRPSQSSETSLAAATPKPAATPSPTRAPTPPLVPIASFFNSARKLVWPNDAPTEVDLGPKRATSDQASLAVLDETQRSGVAPIALVSDARKKLVDYGRPALAYVQARSTSRVADTLHLFLLSLYESLGQAAGPSGASRP